MPADTLLSIIVPFFNSEKKCERLLRTLENLWAEDVEMIFVDDGSKDNTKRILREFVSKKENARLFLQENRGPGGARNTGLANALGDYVWFVDSDDDINLEAIEFLRNIRKEDIDFVDFNVISKGREVNTLGLPEGEYLNNKKARSLLLQRFGRIWSKMIKRDLIVQNKIFYLGDSVSDDNALAFVYPFHVNRFVKAEVVAYYHQEEYESITRSAIGPRYFDRLHSARCGLERAIVMVRNAHEDFAIKSKFSTQFFFNTTRRLIATKRFSNMVIAVRVARQYRSFASRYSLAKNPFVYKHKMLNLE